MIKTWGHASARRLFESGKWKKPGLDVDTALNRLAVLNAVTRLDQISPLKSIGLHRLKGKRKGQWAMTINGPWRLCFRLKDGHAFDVEIVDYH
jgi:proteic killer suppression protein